MVFVAGLNSFHSASSPSSELILLIPLSHLTLLPHLLFCLTNFSQCYLCFHAPSLWAAHHRRISGINSDDFSQMTFFFFFFLFTNYLFIYFGCLGSPLLRADLRCCKEPGLLFVAVRGLCAVVALAVPDDFLYSILGSSAMSSPPQSLSSFKKLASATDFFFFWQPFTSYSVFWHWRLMPLIMAKPISCFDRNLFNDRKLPSFIRSFILTLSLSLIERLLLF